MELNIEAVEKLFNESVSNYTNLLNAISTQLKHDENYDSNTMDPFDYLCETQKDVADQLIEYHALMVSYAELLNKYEYEEHNND